MVPYSIPTWYKLDQNFVAKCVFNGYTLGKGNETEIQVSYIMGLGKNQLSGEKIKTFFKGQTWEVDESLTP